MAEKITLTEAGIAKLQAPAEGRTYFRDTKSPGLSLCVSASGVKTFELCRRIGGRPTRLKIGRHPDITVEVARREVARMCGQIAEGRDPSEQRRKARGETGLGELFALFLDGHAKPHKKSWREDENQFNRYLTAWKNRRLSQIKRADVQALAAKIGKDHGHYASNRLVALLSSVYAYAATIGYEGPNPARGIKKFREQSRDRFLHAEELKAFFLALEAEPDATWKDFFMLALMTGARRANLEGMKWADLELTRGLWKISEAESKNKEPMLIVLAQGALEILQRRGDARTPGGEYVFPSWGKTGHITEPKAAWKRIIDRAGLQNLHVHDLRRTLGSWQAATGASLPIIGRSLGHRHVNTTQIYARLDVDAVRESVGTATAAILAAGQADTTQHKALPAPKRSGERRP